MKTTGIRPTRRLAAGYPRVAIAHDYLTQMGGAERVVLSIHRAFPEAPIYTSFYRQSTTFPEFRSADIRILAISHIPGLSRNHRLALPLLAPAFSATKIRADLVVCSSSGWAHAARTDGRKLVYCHTPARWLYQTDRYVGMRRPIARLSIRILRPLLIRWDRSAARSADRYLTQSTSVRKRIRDIYGIEAQIIPAPSAMRVDGLVEEVAGIRPGYFLCVSRLLPYKNLDAVLEAFTMLPDSDLVIVGAGPEHTRLSRLVGTNVTLLRGVNDKQLAWLYANSRAVIAAAYEDYGLVPLEAAAFGKPTAALKWGGFLDTIVEGQTGTFFDEPTPLAIAQAVSSLCATTYDAARIRVHADQYSEGRFIERLREIVWEMVDQ